MQERGSAMNEGFKGLIVWQKAYGLALDIYKKTKEFPKNEQYGLISQIRRAAISVSANIAEGYDRRHRKEYVQYLSIARGSLSEVETYLLFSKDLEYASDQAFVELENKRQEVGRLLNGLIRSLNP